MAPEESRFPRYDFNGDGKVNGLQVNPPEEVVTPFKIPVTPECQGLRDPAPGCLRDIDVIADANFWVGTTSEEHVTLAPEDGEEVCGLGLGWFRSHSLMKDRDSDGKIDYLLSADLHFIIGPDPVLDFDVVQIQVVSPPFWSKCINLAGPFGGKQKKIVTVPLYSGTPVIVTLILLDQDGAPQLPPIGQLIPVTGLQYGSDKTIKWP